MKYCLIFLIATFSVLASFAQHCPFDGGSAIVVYVKNKAGQPVTRSSVSIFLSETENPKADSCSFAKGLLQLSFGSIENSLEKKYGGAWTSRAKEFVAACSFYNKPGYYAIVLNQSERDCMIKNGNDYRYILRSYKILIKENGIVKQSVVVLPENKYTLCTSAGSWSRIEPIEIVLPE